MTRWRQLFWLSGVVLVSAATVGALPVGAVAWALNLFAAVQLLRHDDHSRPLGPRRRKS